MNNKFTCSTVESIECITNWNKSRKQAFTLAEVLITLGIIGVVSAMTIPSLVQNYQRDTYVTQLHKVYNDITQGFKQVITDSNAVSLGESNYTARGAAWFLNNYFKTLTTCTVDDLDSCFADSYQNMVGTNIDLSDTVDGNCAVIASGSAICLDQRFVTVDVNGKKGPNIFGRDLFVFNVMNDGTIDSGVVGNFDEQCREAESAGDVSCFARIISDGWRMEY